LSSRLSLRLSSVPHIATHFHTTTAVVLATTAVVPGIRRGIRGETLRCLTLGMLQLSSTMTIGRREILHVDMDAFFASVEQLDDPRIRGKPVLVGGTGNRGVVAAASYEARPFGCRSAMPMAVARRLCPHAIVVKGRYWRYRELSEKVFTIFERCTPLIQPISIDEAFLDVTASLPLFGLSAKELARRIKRDIRRETGLAASVGVAPNKFLAKLASDLEKPDGLTVIRTQDVERVLSPLPVERIWGVGPKTAERLHGLGLRTIGDIRATPVDVLRRRVGSEAERYVRLANGEDDRPVVPDRDAKSVGQEQTFGENLASPDAVRDVLLEQVEQVSRRLRKHGLVARGMTVKIRFGDFQTITRRSTLAEPTDATAPLWEAARVAFDRWATESFQPVRLIGAAAGDLGKAGGQLDLFPDPAKVKQRELDAAVDRINRKFGQVVVHRAGAGAPTDDGDDRVHPLLD
jgi:DNA polymerase-4